MNTKTKIGIGVVLVAILVAVVLSTKNDLFQGNYFKQFGKPYSAPASNPFDIRSAAPSRQKRPYTSPAQASAQPPVLRVSSRALSTTRIIQALQDVALFDVVNPASNPTIEVISLDFKCLGSGADNTGFADNDFDVDVNNVPWIGGRGGVHDCRNGVHLDFPSTAPGDALLLAPGASATIRLRYDTSANAGQWATNESVKFPIPRNGLEWIVAANQANRRFDVAGSGYPVGGPALIY